MRKLKTVTPIAGGKRVVCLAGAGILDATATAEAKGREGHSSLGSTFLNPSVAGGVSFGSGGTQVGVVVVVVVQVLNVCVCFVFFCSRGCSSIRSQCSCLV
jgi:hypothetical protein